MHYSFNPCFVGLVFQTALIVSPGSALEVSILVLLD